MDRSFERKSSSGVWVLIVVVVVLLLWGPSLSKQASSAPALTSPAPPLSPASSRRTSSSSADVRGRPSLSAAFVDQVLAASHSPAAGLGQTFYDLSLQYGIDDVFALAFFWHESNFGVNGEAAFTHSIGNLRCYTGAACVDQDRGGYAYYSTWETGIKAWYALIRAYVADGLLTVPAILSRYAPRSDQNDETVYRDDVMAHVVCWRSGQI